MRAGIAFSNTAAAFNAGKDLATRAMLNGDLSQADVLLLFCSANTDYQRLLDGARAVCGANTLILGGSAVGIITQEIIDVQGYPAAALALTAVHNDVTFQAACSDLLARDPFLAGQALGAALSAFTHPELIILFYDSVRYAGSQQQPAVLVPSPPLLQGLYQRISASTPIVGAGLLADLQFGPTCQFYQQQASQHLATALTMSGAIKPYISAMHGCTPVNHQRFTITGIFQQFLYTLDNTPVTAILDKVSGNSLWRQQHPVRRLALGVRYPSAIPTSYSTPFVTRLISGVLPNDDGIILFEPDFHEGMQVQIMQRDTESILQAAQQQTEQLLQHIKDDKHQPIVALYFDCAGRICGNQAEAKLIQRVLTQAQIPLLGIYTGVEIAPVGNQSRSLDWSGVLIILTQPAS
ncbi:FIST signal transduction protein [Alishewanella tabrizica]|uniref:FIST domain-containing protein n=1 Tax=Alishewanella tabrizica TaxID=671278 RepID=A0ABQ2WFD9_9ALTE|nr:FIST N-terminal domain-containing protein [Alishewanella tabrizica]GGW53453.1 hypothetical protein GCM10008111_07100 [Alishewanella tabrizica]